MSADRKLCKWMPLLAAGIFLIPALGNAWPIDDRAADPGGVTQKQSQVACLNLTEITAKNTPVELFPSVAQCVQDERYADAATIMVVALTFGRFDSLRVPDETAHDVVYILQLHSIQDLPDDRRTALSTEIKKVAEKGSPALRQLCKDVRRIGHPTYYPAYMVDHGMGGFTGETNGKSAPGFDAEKAWDKLMIDYLHCE